MIDELSTRGFLDVQGATGKCYFNARNVKKAIQIWEAIGLTNTKEYYQAKAETSSYPACLEWWEKAGDQERIYKEWQDQGGLDKQHDAREICYIGPLLEGRKRYWDACQVYMKAPAPDGKRIGALISNIKTFTPKMISKRNEANRLINHLCVYGQWKTLLILLDKILFPLKTSNEKTEFYVM